MTMPDVPVTIVTIESAGPDQPLTQGIMNAWLNDDAYILMDKIFRVQKISIEDDEFEAVLIMEGAA